MFSDRFSHVVYAVGAEEHRSEGMVGMERGAWCLGMKGQQNYVNATGPQNSDQIDMKIRGFLHCFYTPKISLQPLRLQSRSMGTTIAILLSDVIFTHF